MTQEDSSLTLAYSNQKFRSYFTRSEIPNWLCPHCSRGFLYLDKDKVLSFETPSSIQAKRHPHSDPSSVDGRFSAVFKCNRCCGSTFCTGKMAIDVYDVDAKTGELYYCEYYFPHFFEPAVALFSIPNQCPDDVKQTIQDSFALAWVDLSATGNKLRVVIEKLLVHLDPALSQYGKLHKRLKEYRKSQPEIADLLLAVKWLGNDASHEDSLEECDIAFAYQTIEDVLKRLYPMPATDLLSLARLVNTHKKSPLKAMS